MLHQPNRIHDYRKPTLKVKFFKLLKLHSKSKKKHSKYVNLVTRVYGANKYSIKHEKGLKMKTVVLNITFKSIKHEKGGKNKIRYKKPA